jgi:hypothetical protein
MYEMLVGKAKGKRLLWEIKAKVKKLFLCLTEYHATKTYGGMDV